MSACAEYELKFSHVEWETDQAYLVEFDKTTRVWLPKSKCTILTDSEGDAIGTLSIPGWMVEEKELDFYVV